MMFRPPAIHLENALTVDEDGRVTLTSLRLARGRVAGVGVKAQRGDRRFDVRGSIVLPGLINAHDHLHMNHFPPLKYRAVYAHAHDWSLDIEPRLNTDPVIVAGRAVPLGDRLFIGGLKNLLSGATSVAHHDPMYAPLRRRYPVRVVHRCGWCHSLQRGGDVARSHAATPRDWPWIIHLAEGTNDEAARELDRLAALGCLQANTLVVHGVGLTRFDRARLIERGGGLIWCPASNEFLLGATAQVGELARARKLALGSDSRLTGSRDLLDELARARQTGQVSPVELWRSVTVDAARLLHLNEVGHLAVGARADVLIWPPGEPLAMLGTVRRSEVRAVMIDGAVRVADPEFAALMPEGRMCRVDGRDKLLARDLIERYRRCSIREAGLEVDHGRQD
jgi:cytosine/adenosine deaminase-related metal-dependent hydrolase